MSERRKLVREAGTVRRAGRLERADRPDEDDEDYAVARRSRRRRRPPLVDEVADVNRGVMFAGVESAAVALDVFSRVLRGAVDRAFDEDYEQPGDIVRGVANEADLAVYDLVSELRGIPRKLTRRYEDGLRSPRADRGERARRAENGAVDDDEGSRRMRRAAR